jgi:putative flavoprotein involved in K+ transport
MIEHMDTVVIGAGQAGLAVSYCLKQQGRDHIVLEKHRIAEAWRSSKWDSFTLVSPNWTLKLPGFHYQGDDPDGYLTRDEVVQYLEDYARMFDPPVRTGVTVTAVREDAAGFRVETDQGDYQATNVVVATGAFQKPRIPSYAQHIAPHIHQIHTSKYRQPDDLPSGAVLMVGSGQSGCQITEELYKSGRTVYLCTGGAGRVPRRYRGQEVFRWIDRLGLFDAPVDTLKSPAERFAANPQLTGKDGGKALNLHQFALDGVTLLGRLQNASGSQIFIAGDLMENLARVDQREADLKKGINNYIQQHGLDLPNEHTPELRAGYDSEIITELDLDDAGITSILWATGYRMDFSWIQFPIFDDYGCPIQQRGVTDQPGLYFIGLQWLHNLKSSLFYGMGDDAKYIAARIAEREQSATHIR